RPQTTGVRPQDSASFVNRSRPSVNDLDIFLLRKVAEWETSWLTAIFVRVTVLGLTPIPLFISMVIARVQLWRHAGRVMILLIVASLGSWTIVEILKLIVMRPRPTEVAPMVAAWGYAFPSRHA